MEKCNCCVCGVSIYFEDSFYRSLKNNHNTFYCLNGHGQSFTSKSESEIQKEINQIIKEESNKRIDELKSKVNLLSKNVHQCSYCSKFFSSTYNLKRHIEVKHKEDK